MSLFNSISTFEGYLMLKPSFKKNFPKVIYPKMNVIVWLEFKITCHNIVDQYVRVFLLDEVKSLGIGTMD